MLAEGAENALMSGSGPTVFGIFAEKEKAEAAKEKVYGGALSKEVL